MIVQRHDAPRGFRAADNIFTGANTFTGITTFTGDIVAGTIDADFDDLTATTYGGIIEANLLSRITNEIITGAYTFKAASGIKIQDTGGTDHGILSHDGTDFNSDFTNTADWDVTGLTALAFQDANTAHIELGGSGRGRITCRQTNSIADDATDTFNIPDAQTGAFVVLFSTVPSTEYVVMMVSGTTAVSLHTGSATVLGTSGSNPDTDGKLNVWMSSNGVVSVKNRLGTSKLLRVWIMTT